MVLRKSIVTFLCLFRFSIALSNCYAQKRHLELKNIQTNKVRKIEENKKITVHTKDFKIKGPLKILDKNTILIKGKKIKIDDIIRIENKSLLGKLLSIIGIPIGTLMIAGSYGVTHSPPDSEILITGIIITSVGIVATLLKKNYKTEGYNISIAHD